MPRYSHLVAVCGLLLAAAGCSDESPESASTAADRSGADTTRAAIGSEAPSPQDAALRAAAEDIVAFLRGTATYETLSVADTVDLLIPEEGGGTRHRMAREALRDRHAWIVRADGRQYSFVPPADLTETRMAPSRHFNCLEGPLAARVPEFGASPHVGVRLEPPEVESCLQGWNATFVFEDTPGRPRLTAAIYDQWEW